MKNLYYMNELCDRDLVEIIDPTEYTILDNEFNLVTDSPTSCELVHRDQIVDDVLLFDDGTVLAVYCQTNVYLFDTLKDLDSWIVDMCVGCVDNSCTLEILCDNLNDLLDAINTYNGIYDNEQRIEDHVNLCDLPLFASECHIDPCECYSYDNEQYLWFDCDCNKTGQFKTTIF